MKMDTYLESISTSINPPTQFPSINSSSNIFLGSSPLHLFEFIRKMLNSMIAFEEGRPKSKKAGQASSRKGCMKGKGGPENATCTYKGVRQRTWGKWVAEIRESNNGARLWLGTFDTSYEAAMAYDAAARKLHGPEAKLNLPELAAATRFPPSSGSFILPVIEGSLEIPPIEGSLEIPEIEDSPQIPVIEGSPQIPVPGTNTGIVLSENNSAPTYEKADEVTSFDFSENLKANLPEFDDSSIWKEAAATMDYQAIMDPGIFDNEESWDTLKFPWE